MSALISSAESLKALSIVRSLGKRGISITTASDKLSPIASYSKYSRNNFLYPSPVNNPENFIHVIYDFLIENPHDVLIPVHSKDTLILSKNSKIFSNITKIPFYNNEIIEMINDKALLAKLAMKSNIPIPKTWIPKNLDDVNDISYMIKYPAVIKLRNMTSSTGQSYANNPEELFKLFKKTIINYNLDPQKYPIIQEYINGIGYGVSLLFNHGELRAKFTHKRIREFPASGGPSTCRVSTSHSVMENYAIQLLTDLSWHGIAMVEFILSNEGTPYLLEVNPRFWGSINQAIQSGVDFPYLLYIMATEGDVKPVSTYQKGIVTRNSLLDICSYIQGFRKDIKKMNYSPYLQNPFYDDIFSYDDPYPFFAAIRSGIQQIRNHSIGNLNG